MELQTLGRRSVVADFDGGHITSDAGVVLLGAYDARYGIVSNFAQCFTDYRDGDLIEFTVEQLLTQRVFAIAQGYEDLNDHDTLRVDPVFAVSVGQEDVTGEGRVRTRDRGKPLAGKSTLNRLEVSAEKGGETKRYHKIPPDFGKMDAFLVHIFLDTYATAPAQIILDFDTTDVELHGEQEGRFFHGYYDEYCYTPLYVFCGDQLVAVEMLTAETSPVVPAYFVLKRLIPSIRARFPQTRIIIRGDSGFGDDLLMAWCEREGIEYLFGLSGNNRLETPIAAPLEQARQRFLETGQAARVFAEFLYKPVKTWDRERRVIAKAEHLADGPNPRFVVTNIALERYAPQALYEDLYCQRGNMENRIKEQQLDLFADRCSTHWVSSNTVRVYLHAVAYVLVSGLRREALAGTRLEKASCGRIRLTLLKIGALVQATVRHVWIHLSSACPYQDVFRHAQAVLATPVPQPVPR
jgi:hypothetical protein